MSCEGDVLCADRSSIFLSRHCGSLAVIIVFVHFGHAVAGLRVVCTVRSLPRPEQYDPNSTRGIGARSTCKIGVRPGCATAVDHLERVPATTWRMKKTRLHASHRSLIPE